MERKSFNEELKKKEELEAKQRLNENGQMKLDDAKRVKVLSPGQLVFKRFIRNKLAIFGSIVLIVMFLFSFLAPVFYPYTQTQIFHRYDYAYGLYGVADVRTDYTMCSKPLTEDAESRVSSEAKNNISSGVNIMEHRDYDYVLLFCNTKKDCSDGSDTYVLQKQGNMDYVLSANNGKMVGKFNSNIVIANVLGIGGKVNYTEEALAAGFEADAGFEKALTKSMKEGEDLSEGTFTYENEGFKWQKYNKNAYSVTSVVGFYEGDDLGEAFETAAKEAALSERVILDKATKAEASADAETEEPAEPTGGMTREEKNNAEAAQKAAGTCFEANGKTYYLQIVRSTGYTNLIEVDPGEPLYVSALYTYGAIEGTSSIPDDLRTQLMYHAYDGEDVSFAGYEYAVRDEGVKNQLTVLAKRFEAHDDTITIPDEFREQLTADGVIGTTVSYEGADYAVSELTRLAVRCTDENGNVYDFYADDLNAIKVSAQVRKQLIADGGSGEPIVDGSKTYVVTPVTEFLSVEATDPDDINGEILDTFDARDASVSIPEGVRAELIDNNGDDASGVDYNIYKTKKQIAEADGGKWEGSEEEGRELEIAQTIHYSITRKPLLSVSSDEGIPIGYMSNFIVRDPDGYDSFDMKFKSAIKDTVTEMDEQKVKTATLTYGFPEERTYFDGYEPVKEAVLDDNGNPATKDEEINIEKKINGYEISCNHWKFLIDRNGGPSSRHIFGTDPDGMDILARMMYGGQISLLVGFIVVILETILGVIMGGIAGYFGGWVDNLIMRLVDIFYCIPSMPILIIMGSFMDDARLGTYERLAWMMAILGILGWAGVARLVRGQILSLREQEFMVAAEATGVKVRHRIFRHLLPNVMPQLIVTATAGLGGVILTESTLSFLGLGVKHPLATWGTMINSVTSSNENLIKYTYIWIPVGLLICLTVIAFNFVGDGLRDAFDPKMKR